MLKKSLKASRISYQVVLDLKVAWADIALLPYIKLGKSFSLSASSTTLARSHSDWKVAKKDSGAFSPKNLLKDVKDAEIFF